MFWSPENWQDFGSALRKVWRGQALGEQSHLDYSMLSLILTFMLTCWQATLPVLQQAHLQLNRSRQCNKNPQLIRTHSRQAFQFPHESSTSKCQRINSDA